MYILKFQRYLLLRGWCFHHAYIATTDGHVLMLYWGSGRICWPSCDYQAWDFSADSRILKFRGEKKYWFKCIKTAVFDTRNPKSPYRGRGALPHPPPLGRYASLDTLSMRSLAKLSSSFFKYFLSLSSWIIEGQNRYLFHTRYSCPNSALLQSM